MLYRHFTGLTYTTGVKDTAESKQAYWLIDAIASHVIANPKFKKRCSEDQRFADMQIWILSKQDDGAKLIGVADTVDEELKNPACEQDITFTDFEFYADQDEKFYCAKNFIEGRECYTIMKPSEY
jgi:hypothetical protein